MKPSCSAVATNDRLQVRLAVWGTLARLAVARDVEVLAAMSVDCQPIVNVVGIRVATATIECQMVGGMLGQALVAVNFAGKRSSRALAPIHTAASAAAANSMRFIVPSGVLLDQVHRVAIAPPVMIGLALAGTPQMRVSARA
jgi:hypothetical protein